MTSRISQITDMSGISLQELCEASQVQAYEFYQLMIQAMRENFPLCGGIMPWVFKRPWATVGIQTVDGDDRPGFAYYSVLNSYKPINICWCQEWSVIAPGETLPLTVKVFNDSTDDLSDTVITLTVYNPDLTVFKEYKSYFAEKLDFGILKLNDGFKNKCFLVVADIGRSGDSIARSVYFNKCTDILSDNELYERYRTAPCKNLYFTNGPWFKESVKNAKTTIVEANVVSRGFDNIYRFAQVSLKNTGNVSAYPVTINLGDSEQRFFLSENFFLLKPGEEKQVRITCDNGEIGGVYIDFWNKEEIYEEKL